MGGAPPLRKHPLPSLTRVILCVLTKQLLSCSSTSATISGPSKMSDARLGEENKGHQLLMKMGVFLHPRACVCVKGRAS